MKTTLYLPYTLIVSVLMAWLNTGCSHTSTDATPQGACRIENYVSKSTAQFYDETSKMTYGYDAQGNLVKTLTTSDKRPLNGAIGAQNGTKTLTYTYNADGYVTASMSDELYLTTTDKTTREQITTTQVFAYENGRLSTRTTKRIGAYGVTTTTTELFTYNSSGELITKTMSGTSVVHDPAIAKEIPVGSGASRQIWTYQNNRLVDYVQNSGTSELRPLTIQNGLVTKFTLPSTDGDYVVAYTYDDQQHLIKTEESLGGKLMNAYAQTWCKAKPAESTLPLFKGWPTATQEYGKTGVLLTKKTTHYNVTTGSIDKTSEQTYTIQTNSQGFVINSSFNTVNQQNSSPFTETYTYSGCQ